jgi:hypothetical protein
MWSGVVPQQPPTMFRKPDFAHSAMCFTMSAGDSSYSPKAFGRPAFGWADTWVSAMRDSSSTCGRSSFGPSAQLKPNEIGLAWRSEFQNASPVWPDSVRPEASVMVPEIITGQRRPSSSKNFSTAKMAALAFSVSKMVSISSRSAPPSVRPRWPAYVVVDQRIEGDVAVAGVVHVRRQRTGARGRAEHAGDEARLVRGFSRCIRRTPRAPGGRR